MSCAASVLANGGCANMQINDVRRFDSVSFHAASAARRLEWLFRRSQLDRCCRMPGSRRNDEGLNFDRDDRSQQCGGTPWRAHAGWFAIGRAFFGSSTRSLRVQAIGSIVATDNDHLLRAMARHGLGLRCDAVCRGLGRGMRKIDDRPDGRQRQHHRQCPGHDASQTPPPVRRSFRPRKFIQGANAHGLRLAHRPAGRQLRFKVRSTTRCHHRRKSRKRPTYRKNSASPAAARSRGEKSGSGFGTRSDTVRIAVAKRAHRPTRYAVDRARRQKTVLQKSRQSTRRLLSPRSP